MSRHERRTGCLAPPPLPNSELFCQVERGEEVKLELEVLPIKDVSYVLFSLQLFFLPLKEKCSGVQGQVWRGEGESVSLCQVTDDVVHCSCLCYLNAEKAKYQVRERQIRLGSSLVSTSIALQANLQVEWVENKHSLDSCLIFVNLSIKTLRASSSWRDCGVL